MSCFAQTIDGDLDISSGNLRIERNADQCSAIKLTNRFKLCLAEWFLDRRVGIPYFQVVFVKNPDLQGIAQLFKRIILQTPNMAEVLQETVNFIPSSRDLISDFKIQTLSGAILSGGPGLPFIVEQNGKGTS